MPFRNWDKELTEENLRDQIAQAKQAWKTAEATEPRAESVQYNQSEDLIVIKLKNGAIFCAGFDVGADGADGIFGKGMDGAVREFQQQKGLTADGIVGDETRRVLGV